MSQALNEEPPSIGSLDPKDWRSIQRWLETYQAPHIEYFAEQFRSDGTKARAILLRAMMVQEFNTGGNPPSAISFWIIPAIEMIQERYNCSINEACNRLGNEPEFREKYLPTSGALRRAYYRARKEKIYTPDEIFFFHLMHGEYMLAAMSFGYLSEDDRTEVVRMLDNLCHNTRRARKAT